MSFEPFALLVERLRNPSRGIEELEADIEEAAKVLDRLSPLAKLVLDAIEADRADCILVRGDMPNRRYVTLQDAVRALQAELLRPASL